MLAYSGLKTGFYMSVFVWGLGMQVQMLHYKYHFY